VALGHGAGGTRRTAFLERCAEALAAGGRGALLFNFPYSERRRRIPDPPATLERTIEAVAAFARSALGARRLVLGGKSMGGRIASQAVAKGVAADALVFLGYPLHPPGKPETLRDRHLAAVAAPMLFIQGTRDAFARWDLLEATVARLGELATVLKVEDGDHSFKVPKQTGRSAADVEREVFGGIAAWLQARSL
jgi:predicted alpha/beta-hydrolase family hydrolase